jgi:hypothetical protein
LLSFVDNATTNLMDAIAFSRSFGAIGDLPDAILGLDCGLFDSWYYPRTRVLIPDLAALPLSRAPPECEAAGTLGLLTS